MTPAVDRERSTDGTLLDNLEILKSQRSKLQHALERLIDSFTEGLIEKTSSRRGWLGQKLESLILMPKLKRVQATSIKWNTFNLQRAGFAS
jgi:hypothetical protein